MKYHLTNSFLFFLKFSVLKCLFVFKRKQMFPLLSALSFITFFNVVLSEPALIRYACKWETSFPAAQYNGIAMSSNGSIQAAVDDDYSFYYSNNSGLNVTTQYMRYGDGVAMSNNAQYITVAGYGHIFSSNDSGLTFVDFDIASNRVKSAGMSGSGKYQMTSGYGDNAIWTSNDYGQTFTAHDIYQFDSYGWWSAISSNGSYQIAAFYTTTSYISLDYGQTFTQTPMIGLIDSEISQISLSSDAKYQVMATADQFAVSNDWGHTWRAIFNTEFYGAAISFDGRYQMGVKVNSSRSDYYLSSDFGETFYLGDGMPSGMWLSFGVLSHDGSKAIVSNWNQRDGRIYQGDCGWSVLNYITATVTTEEIILIEVTANVVVNKDIFV